MQRVFFTLHESQALVIFCRGTAVPSVFDVSDAFLLRDDSVEARSEIDSGLAGLVISMSRSAITAELDRLICV